MMRNPKTNESLTKAKYLFLKQQLQTRDWLCLRVTKFFYYKFMSLRNENKMAIFDYTIFAFTQA
jgi:hypothetical protein